MPEGGKASSTLEKLALLIVGFVLTTVCGGLLGSYLQHRFWENQWATTRTELEVASATEVFEKISSLMDRRLYRMNQLLWSFDDRFADTEVENRLNLYRQVVFEWNENLNRNLALIQIHFGEEAREQFEYEVGRDFVEIGRDLEQMYFSRTNDDLDTEDTERGLNNLNIKVYHFNLLMLGEIQNKIKQLSL